MEDLTKEYADNLPGVDYPGIGGKHFVVTLSNTHFTDTVFEKSLSEMEGTVESVEEFWDCGYWIPYDPTDWEAKRNIKPARYMVYRKDGKMHWETFNGTGWAYNEKVITHYAEITPPR